MSETPVALLILSDSLELTHEFIKLFTENPAASQTVTPKYYHGFINGHLSGNCSPIHLYGMSTEFWPSLQYSDDISFLDSWSQIMGIVYLNRVASPEPTESTQTPRTHFGEFISKSNFQNVYPLWNESGRRIVIFNLGLDYDKEMGEAVGNRSRIPNLS